MLETKNLLVGYSGSRGAVIAPFSLQASAGEFVCILGRNGAGKSTLLRTLAGLQLPLSGRVELNGQEIQRMSAEVRAQHLAVVLTERAASPGLTTDDVVRLGRQPFTSWMGRLTANDHARVADAFARSGAVDFRGRLFDDLSDGERQRVMIARAIAQDTRVLLLDEITAFLDLPGRVEVMTLLRSHARHSGVIVILSSHDLDLSLQLADTIWLLDGQGRIVTGKPEALIQSGAIGQAFDTPDVVFSSLRARFELRGTLGKPSSSSP
ncbi:MAG TPA: ABC transporter ATP-binding protein [Opitutaceae bacterium]|nr:ABC transporter ATP-binding protein [Opitutaceae bacterium]